MSEWSTVRIDKEILKKIDEWRERMHSTTGVQLSKSYVLNLLIALGLNVIESDKAVVRNAAKETASKIKCTLAKIKNDHPAKKYRKKKFDLGKILKAL